MRVSSIFVGWLLLAAAAQVAAEEKFRWKGTVDGIDEIAVQGRTVEVDHLEAEPLKNQIYRFSASLPARDVELRLKQVRGRGRVRLMQQPSSRNEFTAVVRIEDEQGGDDDYEFELIWDEDDDWDAWGRDRIDGLFRWEGRVDIGADIEIRGDSHLVRDDGGQGTQEFKARFESSLPSDNVQVAVKKVDGRGKVDLIEAPTAANDYTAVVRVEDDKGGSDIYVFEIRWRR